MIALVIFHDRDSSHLFSWTLKSGFKHVLVCVQSDDFWLEIDYLGGKPDVRTMAKADYDMKAYYEGYGFTVVPTVQQRLDTPLRSFFRFPFLVNNCVGLTMSILGLTGWCITPHSLFQRLTKKHKS